MHRTDVGKIPWPPKTTTRTKVFCRSIYNNLLITPTPNTIDYYPVIIACSGGIDSTVLAHSFAMKNIISPLDKPYKPTLVYINHQLRAGEETSKDIAHVLGLANQLGCDAQTYSVEVKKGNVQAMARDARYKALTKAAVGIGNGCSVLLAHNANDVAETKLFQFLTGRVVNGIESRVERTYYGHSVTFWRPLLKHTREDLKRYVDIWGLGWAEDSTNGTGKYTRNRIRHELIPWVEENVNPSVVKTLATSKLLW